MPRRLVVLLVTWVAAVAALVLPAPAVAAGTVPSSLVASAAPGVAGSTTSVVAQLTAEGAPVAGAVVAVERSTGGGWVPAGQVSTDGSGSAQVPLVVSRVAAENAVRLTWAGDDVRAAASTTVALPLVRQAARLALGGARSVVEFRESDLEVVSLAADGSPVAGTVVVERREGASWRRVAEVVTGPDGRARLGVAPLDDTAYRARSAAQDWVEGAQSAVQEVRVLPSGVPVRLPRRSPSPRIRLPPQPHAVGDGANAVTTTIPDGIWASMTGRSWRPGCPVGRAGLRLVRINYWDYDGFRRRGELVVAAGAAGQVAAAITDMYDARLPIRSMYRVDRFGWSPRLRGADDYRSMAAGNTSAFNCRQVVNRPGVRSPHSSGRALDVNPWENPYRSATGLVPNSWWQSRSDRRVAWRSRDHAVVRIMARRGLRWTYGLGDTQHFDA